MAECALLQALSELIVFFLRYVAVSFVEQFPGMMAEAGHMR